jgi:hypothetical protein
VDSYIAQIILQEAKRVLTKMAATPVVYDVSLPDNDTPTMSNDSALRQKKE